MEKLWALDWNTHFVKENFFKSCSCLRLNKTGMINFMAN